MDRAKYVVLDTAFGEQIVVFSATKSHHEMKDLGRKIVSAGFVVKSSETACGYRCTGESTSLKLKSRPKEDQYLLDYLLGDDWE